jgi:hypothetical protein
MRIRVEREGALRHYFSPYMRLNHFACAFVFLVCVSATAASDGAAALQFHCAGGAALMENTNLSTLHRILSLPSTAEMENVALERLAGIIAQSPPFHTGTANSLIRPLLAGLFKTESLGSFGDSSSNSMDFLLALRLEAGGIQSWKEKLGRILGEPGEQLNVEKSTGLSWPSNSFWLLPLGDWLMLGHGDGFSSLRAEYLRKIDLTGRPVAAWTSNLLEAEVDLSKLAAQVPDAVHLLKPARFKLTVSARENHLEINAHAVYPQPIAWKSTPWQIATDLVQSPLISFTAGQDVGAFLNLSPEFCRIDNNPLTNQFCAWALGAMVFQSYMEWPVPRASNALERLSVQAPAAFNPELKRLNRGEMNWLPNRGRLVLSKRGTVAPVVEVAPAREGQFLLLSLFPMMSKSQPAPENLWAQIRGRSDLVYYDWEATGPRMQQWRLLRGMLLIPPEAQGDETFDAMLIKEKWLNDIDAPKGNTVTEITRTAPNELSLVRTSPFGFTGIELVLMSDWICGSSGAAIK